MIAYLVILKSINPWQLEKEPLSKSFTTMQVVFLPPVVSFRQEEGYKLWNAGDEEIIKSKYLEVGECR